MLYVTCAVVFIAGMAVGAAIMSHRNPKVDRDTYDRSTSGNWEDDVHEMD